MHWDYLAGCSHAAVSARAPLGRTDGEGEDNGGEGEGAQRGAASLGGEHRSGGGGGGGLLEPRAIAAVADAASTVAAAVGARPGASENGAASLGAAGSAGGSAAAAPPPPLLAQLRALGQTWTVQLVVWALCNLALGYGMSKVMARPPASPCRPPADGTADGRREATAT